MGWGRDQRDTWSRVPRSRNVLIDFMAGKLPTFTGLGSLRDLDLKLGGVDQIVAGDTEPRRRDLLDRAPRPSAVCAGVVAFGIFASLSGVGTPADVVHGDGDGFM